jgi:hypothetical protein
MKLLADDLFCSVFMVKNPETEQSEIIIRYYNFASEQEAMDFAQTMKSESTDGDIIHPKNQITIH